ncbi:hypothetical protein G919_01445 [Escherichia coli UMEA 3151-1]|nr:hypothetical protein G919_01445 [Escherichia coli UMEA 3151-1]
MHPTQRKLMKRIILFLSLLFCIACPAIAGQDIDLVANVKNSTCKSGISNQGNIVLGGFAPIFPDTCYHLTHYWPAAADIPVASDNPVHYADAIRYNARTPLQGSLLPLTRLV